MTIAKSLTLSSRGVRKGISMMHAQVLDGGDVTCFVFKTYTDVAYYNRIYFPPRISLNVHFNVHVLFC
jgi:hypothetical protein